MKKPLAEVQPIVNQVARNRWVALLLPLFFLGFVLIVLPQLEGDMPSLSPLSRSHETNLALPPLAQAETLYDGRNPPERLVLATNFATPFFTLHFQPVAQPTNPPPPPPTNKKVTLVYQGFIQNTDGARQAFIKVNNDLFVGTNGHPVLADHILVDVTLRTAVLKNPQGTNVLNFGVPKEIEIPAQ